MKGGRLQLSTAVTKSRTFTRFQSGERSDSRCNFHFRNKQIPPLSPFGRQALYFIFVHADVPVLFSFHARAREAIVLFPLAHNLHKLSYTA